MIRGILAVIIGYTAMAVVVFGGLTGGYKALGTDGAFQEGSWDVTMAWLGLWFVVSLAAALFGGWIASKVSKGPGGVRALAGVVLLLGLTLAVLEMTMEKPDPGARPAVVVSTDAMMNATQPLWVAFLTPLIVLFGVSIGGRGAKKKNK